MVKNPKQKLKYKAVIFDFDDTLVSSWRAKWDQHKFVAKKFYDLDISDEDIAEHWGKSMEILLSGVYRDADTQENMRLALHSTRHDFQKVSYLGSPDVISRIVEEGALAGIVSSGTRRFIMEDLERLGFSTDHFAFVHGDEETEKHKPDGEVFNHMLEILSAQGIEKKDIVYVGDSLYDLDAAHGAGIDFVAITQGLYTREDFEKSGATKVVGSIGEIFDFI